MISSDYVIVGGGLCGLVLAVRLSEDPAITVTVIEAGGDNFHDERIDTPAKMLENVGNPTRDWLFFSTPQQHLGGRPVYLPRGKGLGGSSMLNFMFYNRAASVEYDAIDKFGGQGWSWENLLPYFRKSETFTYSEEEAAKNGMKLDNQYQGNSGPLQRTIPRSVDIMAQPWIQAFKNRGVSYNEDPNDGDNTGVWVSTKTFDVNGVRSSSASAYYEPHRARPNLHIISNAEATRVLTSGEGVVTATGVEFLKDGTLQIIKATREVILSAGSYVTPKILELSGIGDPQVLNPLGISTVVDLPGVGSNLQVRINDHLTALLTFKLKPGHETWENMADPAFAQKQSELYKTTASGMLVSSMPTVAAFLPFEHFDDDGELTKSLDRLSLPNIPIYNVLKDWTKDKRVPFLEYNLTDRFIPGLVQMPEPGANYFTTGMILMHPFNRGSVHITSKDPAVAPAIDINSLDNETDMKILVKGYKYFREMARSEPLKEHIESEVSPGEAIESDEDLIAYIRQTAGICWHPVGTASMLPRKDGGCVDDQLKVYGTTNLRVVDLSVIPINISAHIQATGYAIAEKAADIIKAAFETSDSQ